MYSDLILHQLGENVKAGSPEPPPAPPSDPCEYWERWLDITLGYFDRAERLHDDGFEEEAADAMARARIYAALVRQLLQKEAQS